MSVEAARQHLFGEALAAEEMRPLALLPAPADPNRRRMHLQRAEALLRALAVLEDNRGEESEERAPSDQTVRRLEAKVDLLLGLVAGLMQRDQPADPSRPLQWSIRGAAIELPDAEAAIAAGGAALLRLQPADALPEPVQLPVRLLAAEPCAGGRRLWLAFDTLPPALESLLERHLFRVHRRAVAGSRRPR